MRRVGSLRSRTAGPTIEPFPLAYALAQDRPNQGEHSIYSSVAASFGQLRFGDRIDQCPIDTFQFTTSQMTIEPTQLCLVVFDRSLVGLFSKPANRCVLPA